MSIVLEYMVTGKIVFSIQKCKIGLMLTTEISIISMLFLYELLGEIIMSLLAQVSREF